MAIEQQPDTPSTSTTEQLREGAMEPKEFCQVRHIMGERIHLPMKRELWWFPYKKSHVSLYKRAFKLLFGGKR